MDLGKTQVLSLATKAVTTALGLGQSLIVIRLLSPGEFGLVGLVMSIGGVIGVSQHLGIVDGAIREIAVLKDKREIGKVFLVSHLVRQLVTIPLSLGLFGLAGIIAQNIYGRPEIIRYIQIFAAALILQGLQDVLGASLTGLKKFKALYAVQIATAAINIAVFGYLTWQFKIAGFFWAVIITTSIMVAWFFVLIGRELKGHLRLPTWLDMWQYGRRVLRIGAYMYLARIFFVVWQRFPLLVLGGVLAAEQLGYLNVAMTFGARLTIIAMALSEVNLAWMSALFVQSPEEFRRTATRNMQRVFLVMYALTALIVLFTPEIIWVMGKQYQPAEHLIYVATMAFFLYALIDIGTSSIFVPADKPRLRTKIYGLKVLLSGAVIAWLFFTGPNAFLAVAGMLFGSAAAYTTTIWLARRNFSIDLLPRPLMLLLATLVFLTFIAFFDPSFFVRVALVVIALAFALRQAARLQLFSLHGKRIICFGEAYDAPYWTNRQHVMSRLAANYQVLYIEPRIWIFRFWMRNWKNPKRILSFLWRLVGYQKRGEKLYLISQWNLIPGSREYKTIAIFNHWLNRWRIIFIARLLGFGKVLWLYETEAAEYLLAFPKAIVIYDCVDDHAAQAGAERNPARVREEEKVIMRRAKLVTVTSRKLYEMKKGLHSNVHLVLNAGDVSAFAKATAGKGEILSVDSPVLGTVGALDGYKVDFELLENLAKTKPEWQIVLIGEPIVDKDKRSVQALTKLANVRWLGTIARERVPEYVKQFDVCLIPYRSSDYNAASFPLKFWEFMATGKPIVVSGLPELREYSNLIGYAENSQEFIELCQKALHSPLSGKEERISLAQKHSWEKRVEKLRTLLESVL